MSTVKFVVELTVPDSRLERFKRVAKEMNQIVKNDEPDTLSCKWFYVAGENKWCLTQKFKDSDAFLKHLHQVSEEMNEILEISKVERFEVFGGLSYAARAAIASFGVKHYTYWTGVVH
jgi:quinol monooxygenase YgiN